MSTEAGLPAQLARLDAAASSRQGLEIVVDIAVWQAYQLGPAMIAVNRLVEADDELRARWSGRTGRLARMSAVVAALRREGELRADLSTRDAVALLAALTLPEAITSLRDAGFTQHRIARILTETLTGMLCG
jgi:hypothetical protein